MSLKAQKLSHFLKNMIKMEVEQSTRMSLMVSVKILEFLLMKSSLNQPLRISISTRMVSLILMSSANGGSLVSKLTILTEEECLKLNINVKMLLLLSNKEKLANFLRDK
jgi:hypothetical protein